MTIAELAGYLIVGAVCLLAGCGVGYYTAAKDLEEVRRKAVEEAKRNPDEYERIG